MIFTVVLIIVLTSIWYVYYKDKEERKELEKLIKEHKRIVEQKVTEKVMPPVKPKVVEKKESKPTLSLNVDLMNLNALPSDKQKAALDNLAIKYGISAALLWELSRKIIAPTKEKTSPTTDKDPMIWDNFYGDEIEKDEYLDDWDLDDEDQMDEYDEWLDNDDDLLDDDLLDDDDDLLDDDDDLLDDDDVWQDDLDSDFGSNYDSGSSSYNDSSYDDHQDYGDDDW